MRGFRASRAVHNHKTARFGRQLGVPSSFGSNGPADTPNGAIPHGNVVALKLPDWLKMPKSDAKPAPKAARTRVASVTKLETRAERKPVASTTKRASTARPLKRKAA